MGNFWLVLAAILIALRGTPNISDTFSGPVIFNGSVLLLVIVFGWLLGKYRHRMAVDPEPLMVLRWLRKSVHEDERHASSTMLGTENGQLLARVTSVNVSEQLPGEEGLCDASEPHSENFISLFIDLL